MMHCAGVSATDMEKKKRRTPVRNIMNRKEGATTTEDRILHILACATLNTRHSTHDTTHDTKWSTSPIHDMVAE
jgi:hypothetical protein